MSVVTTDVMDTDSGSEIDLQGLPNLQNAESNNTTGNKMPTTDDSLKRIHERHKNSAASRGRIETVSTMAGIDVSGGEFHQNLQKPYRCDSVEVGALFSTGAKMPNLTTDNNMKKGAAQAGFQPGAVPPTLSCDSGDAGSGCYSMVMEPSLELFMEMRGMAPNKIKCGNTENALVAAPNGHPLLNSVCLDISAEQITTEDGRLMGYVTGSAVDRAKLDLAGDIAGLVGSMPQRIYGIAAQGANKAEANPDDPFDGQINRAGRAVDTKNVNNMISQWLFPIIPGENHMPLFINMAMHMREAAQLSMVAHMHNGEGCKLGAHYTRFRTPVTSTKKVIYPAELVSGAGMDYIPVCGYDLADGHLNLLAIMLQPCQTVGRYCETEISSLKPASARFVIRYSGAQAGYGGGRFKPNYKIVVAGNQWNSTDREVMTNSLVCDPRALYTAAAAYADSICARPLLEDAIEMINRVCPHYEGRNLPANHAINIRGGVPRHASDWLPTTLKKMEEAYPAYTHPSYTEHLFELVTGGMVLTYIDRTMIANLAVGMGLTAKARKERGISSWRGVRHDHLTSLLNGTSTQRRDKYINMLNNYCPGMLGRAALFWEPISNVLEDKNFGSVMAKYGHMWGPLALGCKAMGQTFQAVMSDSGVIPSLSEIASDYDSIDTNKLVTLHAFGLLNSSNVAGAHYATVNSYIDDVDAIRYTIEDFSADRFAMITDRTYFIKINNTKHFGQSARTKSMTRGSLMRGFFDDDESDDEGDDYSSPGVLAPSLSLSERAPYSSSSLQSDTTIKSGVIKRGSRGSSSRSDPSASSSLEIVNPTDQLFREMDDDEQQRAFDHNSEARSPDPDSYVASVKMGYTGPARKPDAPSPQRGNGGGVKGRIPVQSPADKLRFDKMSTPREMEDAAEAFTMLAIPDSNTDGMTNAFHPRTPMSIQGYGFRTMRTIVMMYNLLADESADEKTQTEKLETMLADLTCDANGVTYVALAIVPGFNAIINGIMRRAGRFSRRVEGVARLLFRVCNLAPEGCWGVVVRSETASGFNLGAAETKYALTTMMGAGWSLTMKPDIRFEVNEHYDIGMYATISQKVEPFVRPEPNADKNSSGRVVPGEVTEQGWVGQSNMKMVKELVAIGKAYNYTTSSTLAGALEAARGLNRDIKRDCLFRFFNSKNEQVPVIVVPLGQELETLATLGGKIGDVCNQAIALIKGRYSKENKESDDIEEVTTSQLFTELAQAVVSNYYGSHRDEGIILVPGYGTLKNLVGDDHFFTNYTNGDKLLSAVGEWEHEIGTKHYIASRDDNAKMEEYYRLALEGDKANLTDTNAGSKVFDEMLMVLSERAKTDPTPKMSAKLAELRKVKTGAKKKGKAVVSKGTKQLMAAHNVKE
uniref:Uncharacterized protein n=1 Tax=viral metagenome TaxID=1070528 RepID=A0A2V0RIG3_9ZZZZ